MLISEHVRRSEVHSAFALCVGVGLSKGRRDGGSIADPVLVQLKFCFVGARKVLDPNRFTLNYFVWHVLIWH